MIYTGIVTREGKQWLVEFPDAPGCQTFATSRAKLAVEARDALIGWLEAHLVTGKAPPVQKRRRPRIEAARALGDTIDVDVPPTIAIAIQLRWARLAKGLTQSDLAKRAHVSQQQIAKLERPGENPTVDTLAKVAAAAGMRLSIGFH
jgi:predicted RNase H-like HicB family nuclease/DNA-binding XRE family transcriptional regulator